MARELSWWLIAVEVGYDKLFQLRLSPSKAEKSNTSVKGLLEIGNKIVHFLVIPSKPFALVFDFSALLGDNLN
jgi:hypothetical protein